MLPLVNTGSHNTSASVTRWARALGIGLSSLRSRNGSPIIKQCKLLVSYGSEIVLNCPNALILENAKGQLWGRKQTLDPVQI